MIISRVDSVTRHRFVLWLLAVLAGAAWSIQAGAQTATDQPGKPLMLKPPQRQETPAPQAEAVQPAQPASFPGASPTTVPSASPTTGQPDALGGDRVQEDTLQAIDADSVGTLSVAEGGFGEGLWQGTPRAMVETLLPRLPVNVDSATMRSLTRRLLLSSAIPPATEGKTDSKPGDLIAKRLVRLVAMGDLADAEALLSVTPSRGNDQVLARIEADIRFLNNDNARACALAAAQIQDQASDYWQKALIFCQTLAGQQAKASLGVDLLNELGVKDPVFFALFDALTSGGSKGGQGGPKVLDSMPSPTPLTLAMARAANVPLPADVLALNRPAVLRVVATSPNVPVAMRLEAAERAETAGALPTETLRQLYMAVDFSKEDLANPLSRAEAESGPLSRALLYRTALAQTVPTAQAEAISRAFALARQGGRYPSAVRTFMPILKKVPPSTDLIWFAPEVVRAALLEGETDIAKAWFGILRASGLFNPESATAVAALRPILRLAGSEETADWSPDDVAAWWEGARNGEDSRNRAELLFSLLDAFGDTVPGNLWAPMLDDPQRVTAAIPEPALWFRLRDAAAMGRVGETVMLSLITLGDGGPAGADPVLLHDVLGRLRAAHLDADARALAVEAVLAAGI